MVAVHRVYLEPDGPICKALLDAVTSPVELKDALNASSRNHAQAIEVIGEALTGIISKIVKFLVKATTRYVHQTLALSLSQPRDGILGTAKTSAVAALIQDGNPFPDNYFWQCERVRSLRCRTMTVPHAAFTLSARARI